MKKLLLLAASMSVLSAANAFAQEFPSSSLDNSAMITQTGNLNEATVDQAVDGIINGQGRAEITQNTDRATAAISQTSATSPRADGFANTATIRQTGRRADARVEQIHDYASRFGNTATVVQAARDTDAEIRQRGDRNTGTIRQVSGAIGSVASLDQNGLFNRATIRQSGAGGTVTVRQGEFEAGSGSSPDAFNSRANVQSAGLNADITVTQFGFGNRATVMEEGINGEIDITMRGGLNEATVSQYSTDGRVVIETGDLSQVNIANVLQEVTDTGSSARIEQSGWYGRTEITQRDSLGLGGGNEADVTQAGYGSGSDALLSLVTQDGASNMARVAQDASLALSTVAQSGIGHFVQVAQ